MRCCCARAERADSTSADTHAHSETLSQRAFEYDNIDATPRLRICLESVRSSPQGMNVIVVGNAHGNVRDNDCDPVGVVLELRVRPFQGRHYPWPLNG